MSHLDDCSLWTAFDVAALTSDPGERLAYASVITMLVGLLCLAIGIFRLGFIVNFISRPVLAGFASGSAVLTIISMLKVGERRLLYTWRYSFTQTYSLSQAFCVSVLVVRCCVCLKLHPAMISPCPPRWQDWFRVAPAKDNNAFVALYNLLSDLGGTHWPTFLIGISSFALILGAYEKFGQRFAACC